MSKLDKKFGSLILKRLKSNFSNNNNNQSNVAYLRSKLSKYNAPDYYETHLSKHKNISRFPKRASVLIPISVRQEQERASIESNESAPIGRTYFTLSKRSDLMSSHKGEVCFLGGKKESELESDVDTAYREAREEANLERRSLTFLAQLCPIISYQQVLVTPVLAYFDKTHFEPVLSEEVEMIFDLPTDRFLKTHQHKSKVISNRGGDYHIHYFKDEINGKSVYTWGMTAFLAIVVSSLLHAKQPEFELVLGKRLDLENTNKYLEQHLFSKLSVSEANKKN